MLKVCGVNSFNTVVMAGCYVWHRVAADGSIKITNNEGEGGHPCLVPR